MATLADSVINIVRSFSEEDMNAFIEEFSKLQKPVAKCKPKKQSTLNLPSPSILAKEKLMQHRAKYNIPAQGKLA